VNVPDSEPVEPARAVFAVTLKDAIQYPSDTMAVPVSDGEIVGVTFGYGQIAAYELATGRRLWAWRDPDLATISASHCQSPLMWKDMFLVPGGGRSPGLTGSRAQPDQFCQTILGVDKRTGVIRWEQSRGPGGTAPEGTHGDHMSPFLGRLPDGPPSSENSGAASKGALRAVVIANMGAVIDAESGEVLAQLPGSLNASKHNDWGSGFVGQSGQRIFKALRRWTRMPQSSRRSCAVCCGRRCGRSGRWNSHGRREGRTVRRPGMCV
jgi:hypothetical protein